MFTWVHACVFIHTYIHTYTYIQKDVQKYRHTDSMHAYPKGRFETGQSDRFGFGHPAGGAEHMHVYMGACMCVNKYIQK